MKIVKLGLAIGLGLMVAAVLVWILLAVGCANPQCYLALARAGLLVFGSGGCTWGLLWHRVQIVMVGLLLLGVGVLPYFYQAH